MMNCAIPYNIQNIISHYLYDLTDVINLYNLSKEHHNHIIIVDMYNRKKKQLKNLTQNILEQSKFKYLQKLNVLTLNIFNLDHLQNTLKILKCEGITNNIGQAQINNLHLVELYAENNKNIYDVNHMNDTLKILNCSGSCGIDQFGISLLNLKELYAWTNQRIHNVNHLKDTLNILHCGHLSSINQNGISSLNLSEISVWSNYNITNVNHMTSLQILNCDCDSEIIFNLFSDNHIARPIINC